MTTNHDGLRSKQRIVARRQYKHTQRTQAQRRRRRTTLLLPERERQTVHLPFQQPQRDMRARTKQRQRLENTAQGKMMMVTLFCTRQQRNDTA